MDVPADPQSDTAALISFMKSNVEQSIDASFFEEKPTLVLLCRKDSSTARISPWIFIREGNGEYKPTKLPDNFGIKLVSGDAHDEMEVNDPSNGRKHYASYNTIQKLISNGALWCDSFLFKKHNSSAYSSYSPREHLVPFFSSSQTIIIPLQKLYPYSREINAQFPTAHNNIFRMAEVSGTALIAFRYKFRPGSIILPHDIVAVTPEGCFTLPCPIEKIKGHLEEENNPDSLPDAILNALTSADSRDPKAEFSDLAFVTTFQENPTGIKPTSAAIRALLEATQADSLSGHFIKSKY
jgi:hypothetical protein